ncbi:unnamed protein product [Boreogadus saida]
MINTVSIEINPVSIEMINTGSIEINPVSIEINTVSIEMINPVSIEMINTGSIEINTGSIEINPVSIEINTVSIEMINPVSIEINTVSIEINTVSIEINPVSIEINTGSIEINTGSIEINPPVFPESRHKRNPSAPGEQNTAIWQVRKKKNTTYTVKSIGIYSQNAVNFTVIIMDSLSFYGQTARQALAGVAPVSSPSLLDVLPTIFPSSAAVPRPETLKQGGQLAPSRVPHDRGQRGFSSLTAGPGQLRGDGGYSESWSGLCTVTR